MSGGHGYDYVNRESVAPTAAQVIHHLHFTTTTSDKIKIDEYHYYRTYREPNFLEIIGAFTVYYFLFMIVGFLVRTKISNWY